MVKMQDIPLGLCTSGRYCYDGYPGSILIPYVFPVLDTAKFYPKDNFPQIFYNNLFGADSGKAILTMDNVKAYTPSICPSSNFSEK